MPDLMLVTYATYDSSLGGVAQVVGETLQETGFGVELHPLADVRTLENYCAIVMGMRLSRLNWHNEVFSFLSRHRQALLERHVAVFVLGPKNETKWQYSHAKLDQVLGKFPWFKPLALKIFERKYDLSGSRFSPDWVASQASVQDVQDWMVVRDWANSFVAKISEQGKDFWTDENF